MDSSALAIANAWSGVGKEMFQGDKAFRQGELDAGTALAKKFALEATGMLNQEKALAEQQRRQYQTPEFGSKIAAAMIGLPDGAGSELDQFQQRGNWGMNPEQPLPMDQSGPPRPEMPKAAPNWYQPGIEQKFNMARGAHLANLGGTGDSNAKQMAEAYAELAKRTDIDRAMRGGVGGLNALQAAMNGKLYDGTTRGVLSQETGQEAVNPDWQAVQRSSVAENYAQAGNANASAALSRSKIGQGQTVVTPDGTIVSTGGTGKPMPAAALKMQNEELEELSLAAGNEQRMDKYLGMLQSGQLELGPLANNVARAKNFVGIGDKNSANYASFVADMEKMRNDSLRLNKGVQTEGDAVRAWNEMFANLHDKNVVMQRLDEIKAINARAASIREMNVQNIRNNYGAGKLDTSGYRSQQQQTASPPKIQRGQVVDGYRFKGGNPADQTNWEPVK